MALIVACPSPLTLVPHQIRAPAPLCPPASPRLPQGRVSLPPFPAAARAHGGGGRRPLAAERRAGAAEEAGRARRHLEADDRHWRVWLAGGAGARGGHRAANQVCGVTGLCCCSAAPWWLVEVKRRSCCRCLLLRRRWLLLHRVGGLAHTLPSPPFTRAAPTCMRVPPRLLLLLLLLQQPHGRHRQHAAGAGGGGLPVSPLLWLRLLRARGGGGRGHERAGAGGCGGAVGAGCWVLGAARAPPPAARAASRPWAEALQCSP